MKILYSWLKDFVPLELSAEQAAGVLGRLGFEIVAVSSVGPAPSGVVTATVLSKDKHPNADRLSVCQVNDGTTTFTVVCGAPNVAAGQKVALARVGAKLPNGLEIKAAKIRGTDSAGMLCSSMELGLQEPSEGILVLDPAQALGVDIRTAMGWDDVTIEFDITPNRRDVLSVIGVARELSAALNLPLKHPEPRPRELDPSTQVPAVNEAPDACNRYIARVVKGLRVGPSPAWMAKRLINSGLRPINNIVDITNYIMLECGQPLHAFDVNKLKGRRLRIRSAHDGETLVLLDGKTVTLKAGMLVIADEEKPAALAGIMGGKDSAISNDTTDIVIESASFHGGSIRQTSRALGVSSDSSYRFERGTDFEMVAAASARAAQLVQELAGGLGYKPMDISPRRYVKPAIRLRTDRVRQLLGIDLKESVIADMLRRLGCVISRGSESHLVTVPSWRTDLEMEADLVEEIARLHGYDNIPARVPTVRHSSVPDDPSWIFERSTARKLAALGLMECCHTSFTSPSALARFTPGFGQPPDTQPAQVLQPLSNDLSTLRTSLIPGLLATAAMNFRRRQAGLALFEIGRVFGESKQGLLEDRRVAIVLSGVIHPAHWRGKGRSADFYDLKGLLEAYFERWQLPERSFSLQPYPSMHPKRSVVISCDGRVIGWMGEVHPRLQADLDSKEAMLAAELDVEAIRACLPGRKTTAPPNPYPPVARDLSIIAQEVTPYELIVTTLTAAAGTALESCQLIDLYRGATIGQGKKSLTLSLVFRHPDRTLTDSEVEQTMKKILSELSTRCDAVIRQ